MELVHEDCFMVFKRTERSRVAFADMVEQPHAACSTYAEARRVLHQLHQAHQEGVIRYLGLVGGSD